MSIPILSTKLYIPPLRPKVVPRRRLIERLNDGLLLHRKLTLLSAPAGYGKTTLVSEWLAGCPLPAAWLSLDEGDNDPPRFLAYLLAALQTIGVDMGEEVMSKLQTPSSIPLPIEAMVTATLQRIIAKEEPFMVVLDDYHVIDSKPIDNALAFLIEFMPQHMHLVIACREDPDLPLARMRVRDQLTEMRTADLRFTSAEASEFMHLVMELDLSQQETAMLESRTEGWIAGLQLAALSLQGHKDAASFIESFNGHHHLILDYLVEEVLQQQPKGIQDFLLSTSILDRLCGPLCEAILGKEGNEFLHTAGSGQDILEYLERGNLFIVPLDKERRWYRYHHLFKDLLRDRLSRRDASAAGVEKWDAAELHLRASEWYEHRQLELEAFQHAIAAHDVDRAARLIEGEGMPLLFRGAIAPVLNWLDSLPKEELDARPALHVLHASAWLMVGRMTGVERKLQAAEFYLPDAKDGTVRDLIGHIASIRAALAVSRHQGETILKESLRALEYLSPDNLPVRTATMWTLGYAYQLQGDRYAAGKTYAEAAAISHKIGHFMIAMMATLGLGNMQEAGNLLFTAAGTYQRVLELAGDPPLPAACEAHLGLARIFYEWNDLDMAERHGQQALQWARQFEHTDRAVASEVFLARMKLSRGKVSEALTLLAKAEQFACQHHYVNQLPAIAAVQVLALLLQGHLDAADRLAKKHELKASQARVHFARGDMAGALAKLEPLREQAQDKVWEDEQLKVLLMLALALQAQGEKLKAAQIVIDALAMAEPGGFIRLFVDEGAPMLRLLTEAAVSPSMRGYRDKLLNAFEAEAPGNGLNAVQRSVPVHASSLIEPLTRRELEVLRLIAQGLSNRQISERLFLALSTVKGHNRIIFDKLQVMRRTEAVAYAREMGLL